MKKSKPKAGLTLVELMIAGAILTVVSLSIIGVLGNFATAITSSREVTLANHLAEEKLESIKSQLFYAIMVTSTTPPVLDTNFSPPLPYDPGYYPPEDIKLGGTTFSRKVFIEKTATPSGYVEDVGYPHPDTGLKRITVMVSWQKKTGGWKKVVLTSLASNPDREPLDRNIFGVVTDNVTSLPVDGAQVLNKRNPGQGSTTDINGYYSFQTTDDDIRVISEKYGYDQYYSASFSVNYGTNEFNFSMVPISSEPVTGWVVTYSSLVISGVNLQWDGGINFDKYYIELFNGSTETINALDLQFEYVDSGNIATAISITTNTTTIPASSYFLLLGSPGEAATLAPNGRTADATFDYPMNAFGSGGIRLLTSGGAVIDQVAWGDGIQPAPSLATEGTGLDLTSTGFSGPGVGGTIVRLAFATTTAADMSLGGQNFDSGGNAWDSQNNNSDFVHISTTRARNSTDVRNFIGGRAFNAAVVTGTDEISTSTTAASNGTFTMWMQTGNWSILATSSSLMANDVINVVTGGPNEKTLWVVQQATVAIISGNLIKYGGGALNGIIVQADPGGYQEVSANGGLFTFLVPADNDDSYYLTANPDYADPNWNTAISPDPIEVDPGEVSSGHQLSCWANSYVSGRVTTNGTDGLPGIPVQALGQWSNGNSSLTDAAGYYIIPGLRIAPNPYDVFPVLTDDQSSTPPSINLNVVKGVNTTGIDFVVSGGRVPISGQALISGSPITSGVNVFASTMTYSASSPPDITFALRKGGQRHYQAVTDGEGYYSLSVLGGQTYNLIAWYTTTSTTTPKLLTVTVPSNAGSSGNNFSW